ncbi:MAG TPA: hypothetical protein VFZ00_06710 [Solirubrobacter sp.]|nr:hypothetical protein [Solirubrobacter sp.]
MSRHIVILTLLAVLGGAGVFWQVHSASAAALERGERPAFVCPLAGHPFGG